MVGGATLIHPHPASNLPGYKGYTPQLKFQCGHTYGYQTDQLLTEYTNAYPTKYKQQEKLKLPDLPISGRQDEKYVKQMVPGYTGFVPQHTFKYGQTYADGAEEAVAESKSHYSTESAKQCELRQSVRNPKTLLHPTQTPPRCHPWVNMKYVLSLDGSKFSDKREFVEPPIPGYQGCVPKKEEHILGERYNMWTRHAYGHAAENIASKEMKKEGVNVAALKGSPVYDTTGSSNRLIYSKRLGMIPNYTGFVPQRRFNCGDTYGDATRSMPVCFDTAGYSDGKYNETKKGVTPTVIPVRI